MVCYSILSRCGATRIGLATCGAWAVACMWGCSEPAPRQPQRADSSSIAGPAQSTARRGRRDLAQTHAHRNPEGGEKLYARHCAGCHGAKGDGQGLAARFLFPKPRDFRAGKFRLVSTVNNVPTSQDILAVLVGGMPGSAMTSWAHLNERDRNLLVAQVLEFRRQGARDVELALAAEAEEELGEEELEEAVHRVTTPGEVLEVPRRAAASPQAVARGKELYRTKGCVACHGEKGKGDGQEKMVDIEGLPTRPRDLTRGIFKGSPEFASVYRRIGLGMPGSPMPSSQILSADQIADLVHFVLSLSDERARTAAVMKRHRLVAKFVQRAPAAPGATLWSRIRPVRLTMAPLWWRDQADPALEVRAVHDGKLLSLLLSWTDPEPNTHSARSEAFKDAIAAELHRGETEPFVGMGGPESPVEVWMWDADRQGDPVDVEDANPNIVVDLYPFSEQAAENAEYVRPGTQFASQPQVAVPALASGNLIVPRAEGTAATVLEAAGPGSVTFLRPTSQLAKAQGKWAAGRWVVVMSRPLASPKEEDGLSMRPGERVSIAFAIWNGSLEERDGQKWITIWQDLVLGEATSPLRFDAQGKR